MCLLCNPSIKCLVYLFVYVKSLCVKPAGPGSGEAPWGGSPVTKSGRRCTWLKLIYVSLSKLKRGSGEAPWGGSPVTNMAVRIIRSSAGQMWP